MITYLLSSLKSHCLLSQSVWVASVLGWDQSALETSQACSLDLQMFPRPLQLEHVLDLDQVWDGWENDLDLGQVQDELDHALGLDQALDELENSSDLASWETPLG